MVCDTSEVLVVCGVAAWLICLFVPFGIFRYTDREIQRIAVVRFLEPTEMQSLESRVSFPISETEDSSGTVICLARDNDRAANVTLELKRMGVYTPLQPP